MDAKLHNDLINAAMEDPVLYACAKTYGLETREGLANTILQMAKANKAIKEALVRIARSCTVPPQITIN